MKSVVAPGEEFPGTLLCTLEGPRLTPAERELLSHPRAGGVVLFERNFQDRAQLTALLSELRALRSPSLLVTVDQEGGRVQRLRGDFSPLPAAVALGALYSRERTQALEAARALGWLMAAELRAVGVDLSFAPILDLDRGHGGVLASRAFSSSPEATAELGLAWIEGAHSAGMVAVAKHYPGHGGVPGDSHKILPRDTRPRAALKEDLLPFQRALRAGLRALMTAHVLYQALDPERPAGFSPAILRGLLRAEQGFQGLIFSDDLCMAGARTAGDPAARVRAARRAGCDLLVLCHDAEAAWESLEELATEQPRRGKQAEELEARVWGRLEELRGGAAPAWEELRALPRWRAARAWCERLST